ncbi:MAG: hypothetical protein FGM41_02400 [Bacteroidetes bacterium]|jgi:hypothetical protein|nr:hypothetical protein [Bacteroidota bacterium]
MELKDLVAIAGQSGLHHVVGRSKNGLIVETIGTGRRFSTSFQDKVSVLEDISVYTVNEDMRLVDVFVALKAKGDAPEAKGDLKEVRKYLVEAINLDSERVYDNDIKKLMNWFHLLKDVLDFEKLKASQTNGSETAEEVGTEEVKEKKVAKAAAVKTEVKKQVKTATPKANSKANNSNKTTFRQKSV